MPRQAHRAPAIGERIKARRNMLGLSIRKAADLAGVDNTTLGRIEKGLISADNRIILANIARALRCSVTDLTGQPTPPVNRAQAETSGAVNDTIRAFCDVDLELQPDPPAPPLAGLVDELELVRGLRTRCEYAGAAARLPHLAYGLYAATAGRERDGALRALVHAADTASFVVRYAGHPGASHGIADRAWQAAQHLEDPVMLGVAAFSRAHAASGMGSFERMLKLAERGAAELEPHVGLPDAPEMLGQLFMTQAFALYALGRTDDALTRVDAAERIAARTGDSPARRQNFGPTNIRFWRISMEADGDSPGRAIEIAADTNWHAVESVSRQVAFFMDTGRAYARIGRDADALRMLRTAERMAPERVHKSPIAAETVRGLLERARRGATWSELRGMAERLNVSGG